MMLIELPMMSQVNDVDILQRQDCKVKMVRARKDSEGSHIDQYRKHIGKQDNKKSKAGIKEAKVLAQAKKDLPHKFKDIMLMLVATTIAMLAIYLLLYVIIAPKSSK